MLRVGIIGLGFIGHVHYKAYRALKDKVTIAAICDIERERLDHPGAILGNIDAGPDGVDLSEAALYTDAAKMLAEQKLDLVSIGLPTYLHAKYTRMALEAGVHKLVYVSVLNGPELRGLDYVRAHEDVVDRLIDLANERGGQDNITAVLVEVQG